jgi:uncharacterized protein
VVFWDLYGEQGHPVRTTSPRSGRRCSRACSNSTTPSPGVLDVAFRLADDEGLLLLDLKDLRALLNHSSPRAKEEISTSTAWSAPQSVAAIQRALLRLERGRRQDRSSASRRWSSAT